MNEHLLMDLQLRADKLGMRIVKMSKPDNKSRRWVVIRHGQDESDAPESEWLSVITEIEERILQLEREAAGKGAA